MMEWRARRRGRGRRATTRWVERPARTDAGFTLAEVMVTLIVFAIIVALTGGIVREFSQQSVNLNDSNLASEQEITAGEAIQPYSHSALFVVVSASPALPSKTQFEFVAYSGFNYSSSAGSASCVLVNEKWTAGKTTSSAAAFTISTTPANCSTGVTSGTTTTIGTYSALGSQSPPVFQYLDSAGKAISPLPPCEASTVYAVIVTVTFLSGPQVARAGFASNHETTLYNEIYFQPNSATTTTNAATTTTTVAGCNTSP